MVSDAWNAITQRDAKLASTHYGAKRVSASDAALVTFEKKRLEKRTEEYTFDDDKAVRVVLDIYRQSKSILNMT